MTYYQFRVFFQSQRAYGSFEDDFSSIPGSIKADSAEKSAQDQVVMVAELNTHPQLFLDIKVKALFGTLRSGMGVLNGKS